VYIGSSLLWTVFNIGCARAQNIETLLVCRFFAGFFGCACLTNGGGSSVDIFEGLAVLRGTVVYSAIVFLGPVLGPIIGGAVAQYSPSTSLADNGGFRWLFYAAVAAGALVTILHCFCMETHHNTRLRRRVAVLRKAHPDQPWTTMADSAGLSVTRKVLATTSAAAKMLIEEPIIILISVWQTTIMAIIYLFFESFAVIFGLGHGFDSFQVGLSFLGVGVGMLLACLWAITGEPYFWMKRVNRTGGEWKPELRIPMGLAGACLTVVGLFWFGYTSYPSIHWIVPIIGSAVYGMGALSAMLATFSYIVDTYAMKAAPAFAAVGLIRSVITGVLPLCGTQFYVSISGRGWGCKMILVLL
jgi:MFS family permease